MSVLIPKRLEMVPVLSLYHHLVDQHGVPRRSLPDFCRQPVGNVDLGAALDELSRIHRRLPDKHLV
jgi:hypothetical protein